MCISRMSKLVLVFFFCGLMLYEADDVIVETIRHHRSTGRRITDILVSVTDADI